MRAPHLTDDEVARGQALEGHIPRLNLFELIGNWNCRDANYLSIRGFHSDCWQFHVGWCPESPLGPLEDSSFGGRWALLILAGISVRSQRCLHFLQSRAGNLVGPEQLAGLLPGIGPPDRRHAPPLGF